jgi:hypothetical protein
VKAGRERLARRGQIDKGEERERGGGGEGEREHSPVIIQCIFSLNFMLIYRTRPKLALGAT